MRKGITSGGRRESEYVCGVSLTNSGRRLWGLKAEETPLASGQLGFPLCLPGPWGAWVPASWIWDSGVEAQCAPSQADPMEDLHRLSAPCPLPPPKLLELKTQESRNLGLLHQEDSGPGLPLSWLQDMETSAESLPRTWQLTKSLVVGGGKGCFGPSVSS